MCSKIKFILTINLQPVVGSAIQMYNHPPTVMILMIGNKFFATKNHCLCLGLFLLAAPLHCCCNWPSRLIRSHHMQLTGQGCTIWIPSVVNHCVLITPDLIKFHSPILWWCADTDPGTGGISGDIKISRYLGPACLYPRAGIRCEMS